MITRWFPPKERPFALGFVTGGRQIGWLFVLLCTNILTGTLLILPLAGVLCENTGANFGGWPAIFYLSSIIGTIILIIWLVLSADKPSKHFCVSQAEETYIGRKIEEERLGKRSARGSPPWGHLIRCRPLYVSIAALVCHEYPLVIMLQFLPKFFSDVLGLSNTVNGLVSALPSVVLFIFKTLSSSVSSLLTARKPPLLSKTASCKMFNLVASLGLGICIGVTPLLGNIGHPAPAILVLCMANAFAGYSNEVGEAFRSMLPTMAVRATYVVALGYVCADAFDKSSKIYRLEWPSLEERRRRVSLAAADTFIWQVLASVAIPGFTINRLCYFSGKLLQRVTRWPSPVRKWLVTVIGLGMIPFIVKPIDSAVEIGMDETLRKIYSHPHQKSQ
uniref:Mitochondrial fission process protein 1 n=1 Tax=Heterorhabditis bacteriophora TaxID=37862 RepID=A0A1I7X9R4_HETBA